MRRSGWILPAAALVAWIAAVGYPALALMPTLVEAQPAEVAARNMASLFMTSFAWALSVAIAAEATFVERTGSALFILLARQRSRAE